MSVRVHCKACERSFRAQTKLIGTTKPCPGCKAPLRIGSATANESPGTYALRSAQKPPSLPSTSYAMQSAIDDALADPWGGDRDRDREKAPSHVTGTVFWPVAAGIAFLVIGGSAVFQTSLSGPQSVSYTHLTLPTIYPV